MIKKGQTTIYWIVIALGMALIIIVIAKLYGGTFASALQKGISVIKGKI